MGEVSAGLPGDPFNWLTNPGANRHETPVGIGLFHSQWILDTYYDNVFYRNYVSDLLAVGLGLTYVSTPDVQGYDASGLPTKSLKNNNLLGVVGIGLTPVRGLSSGVNLKFFQETIADWTAKGFALDIGAMYTLPLLDLTIGASVQNIGQAVKFIAHEEELPLTFRLGGSYRIPVIAGMAGLLIAVDMVKPRYEETYPAFGCELSIRNIVALRAGYSGDTEKAFDTYTLGGGIMLMQRIALDYTFTPYGDLGSFHRISLFFGITE
jgi:hypothetical protein